MQILPISDLHLEFHEDYGERFIFSFEKTDVDVLVLAGDITVGSHIPLALHRFSQKFSNSKILYLHGNHEFYGTSRNEVEKLTQDTVNFIKSISWLNNSIVEINSQRFLGTTLWYRSNPLMEAQKWAWSDFRLIHKPDWITNAGREAVCWLDANLREDDIVISHMLPTPESIIERWRTEPTNSFFLNDVKDLILERKPRLWIHGHTHDSIDVKVGNTRVICNPFGYEGHTINPSFKKNWIIEI